MCILKAFGYIWDVHTLLNTSLIDAIIGGKKKKKLLHSECHLLEFGAVASGQLGSIDFL